MFGKKRPGEKDLWDIINQKFPSTVMATLPGEGAVTFTAKGDKMLAHMHVTGLDIEMEEEDLEDDGFDFYPKPFMKVARKAAYEMGII